MERVDHDAEVQRRIAAVTDLGLPNEGWDASLRQTLERMLHYDAEQRLDARQCVKLFRAFKEQAAGDSLSAFAEQVVGPMTGQIFADQNDGQLSGAQFAVPPSSTDVIEEEEASPTNVDLTEPPTAKAQGIRELETQALPREELPQPIGVRATTSESGVEPARPGFAFGNLNVDEVQALPTHEEPNLFHSSTNSIDLSDVEATTDPGLDTEDTLRRPAAVVHTPPPAAPPTQPADTSPNPTRSGLGRTWLYTAIGCTSVSLLIGVGAAFIWIMFQKEPPATDSTTAIDNEAMEIVAGSSAEQPLTAQVTLSSGGATIQWIRLIDSEGTTRINAKPDGSATVPTGDYKLRVKVVARPVFEQQISVEQDLTLSCKPATGDRVKCMSGTGQTYTTLQR